MSTLLLIRASHNSHNRRMDSGGQFPATQLRFQPSWGAIAAALRARSLDLRWALAARVLICFSRLLLSLSLRCPIKISFQYFYQTCHAVPDFIANKAFSVLLQLACNTYPRIVSTRQGKSNELFSKIEYELTFPI